MILKDPIQRTYWKEYVIRPRYLLELVLMVIMFLIMRQYATNVMNIPLALGNSSWQQFQIVIIIVYNCNYTNYLNPFSAIASFYLTPTGSIEVLQLINSIKAKKSSGIDRSNIRFF